MTCSSSSSGYVFPKSVRTALVARRKKIVKELGDLDTRIVKVVASLRQAQKRVACWPLKTRSSLHNEILWHKKLEFRLPFAN